MSEESCYSRFDQGQGSPEIGAQHGRQFLVTLDEEGQMA